MSTKPYSELREKLLEIAHLDSVGHLAEWDQNVSLSEEHKGHKARAGMMGYVAGLKHKMFTGKEFEDVLMRAVEDARGGKLTEDEKFIVLKTLSDLEKEKKLPTEFVAESEKLYAEAHQPWEVAREKSDFSIFEPYLVKIVAAKRREAKFRGYRKSPYDALLDRYEPGLTTEYVTAVFDELKAFLVPFIDDIRSSKVKIQRDFLYGSYPLNKQLAFAKMVIREIGFDLSKGRVDTSTHPFCTNFHPTDVRITTRFDKYDFFNQAFFSLIHEAGHGIYEQALPEEYFGTPLGEYVSMGIHEANSRFWENFIGRSLLFWVYFYPKLQRAFPGQLQGVSLEDFYRAINYVEPGFIRVDADEVTYNLHVAVRIEIEPYLIDGSLKVKEVPHVWNEKMEDYLGLKVKKDADGALQDCHWSGGDLGYFGTYGLGNINGGQLHWAASEQIYDFERQVSEGNFASLREWLRTNIHQHGRRYTPEELIVRATGDKPLPVYLIKYLEDKYSEIYNL